MDNELRLPKSHRIRGWVLRGLDVLLGACALAAVAALVLEYGFRTPPVSLTLLHAAEVAIVVVFVLERCARLLAAPNRRQYLRGNWIDFALMALAGGLAVAIWQFRSGFAGLLSAGALYVFITQAYLLVTVILRLVGVNLRLAESGLPPAWVLIGGFAFLCLAGSGLLMLPAATPADGPVMYYPDALFTATSATCVTGLIVRDTATDFTPFGQAVILVLIQVGGLGIMMFGTMLAILMGRGLSFRSSVTVREVIATEHVGRIGHTVSFVILVTFALEAVGAALFYPMFAATPAPDGGMLSTGMAAWQSVFHSVSSFCNAGFSLFTHNMAAGVPEGWSSPLRDHWQILGVMAPLIVLGGVGFPVLQDVTRYLLRGVRHGLARLRRPTVGPNFDARSPRLSLHSRMVLTTTAVLLVIGALGLMLVEPRGEPAGEVGRHELRGPGSADAADWDEMTPLLRMREGLFLSVSARTAGFNTFDINHLSDAGKLWTSILMVIGGSPASTAGGMKTATFALLLVGAWGVIRRRAETEVFSRSIRAELFRKAVTLAVLYLLLVATVTLLLAVLLRSEAFIDVLVEATSACGTVGLSAGVTQRLNTASKHVIIAAMFAGRVGPLTLLLALTSRLRKVNYAYPCENVVIG